MFVKFDRNLLKVDINSLKNMDGFVIKSGNYNGKDEYYLYCEYTSTSKRLAKFDTLDKAKKALECIATGIEMTLKSIGDDDYLVLRLATDQLIWLMSYTKGK